MHIREATVFREVTMSVRRVLSGLGPNTDVREYTDHVVGKAVMEIRKHLYGTRKPRLLEEKVVEVPATWWDHFKQRWLPWAKVATRKITTKAVHEVVHVCPHVEAPNNPQHLRFMLNEELPGISGFSR